MVDKELDKVKRDYARATESMTKFKASMQNIFKSNIKLINERLKTEGGPGGA
jgi:hypothetical protein